MSSRVARIERRLAILTWQVCALTAIAAVAGVPALWMITGGDFSRLDPEDIDPGDDDGAALCLGSEPLWKQGRDTASRNVGFDGP